MTFIPLSNSYAASKMGVIYRPILLLWLVTITLVFASNVNRDSPHEGLTRSSAGGGWRFNSARAESLHELHHLIHSIPVTPTTNSHVHIQSPSINEPYQHHAIRLHSHVLNLDETIRIRQEAPFQRASPPPSRDQLVNHATRVHTLTAARSSTSQPHPPHKIFTSAFFHEPSGAVNQHLNHQPHILAHDFESRSPFFEGTEVTSGNLHIPNAHTLDVMQTYFTAGGQELSEILGQIYATANSTSQLLPAIDSPNHPLQAHPKFHYQWLIHLKGPITPEVIDSVEKLISPYKLVHYIQQHSYLISLPYGIALKLQQTISNSKIDGSSIQRNSILFICMYHPTLKVQADIASLIDERLDRKKEISQREFQLNQAKNPFIEPSSQRPLSHEFRLTFTHPHFDPSLATAAPSSLFPQHRQDTTLMDSYASKQERYWNKHPQFLAEMDQANTKTQTTISKGIEFIPVNSHQILIKLPADLTPPHQSDSFLHTFLTKISSHHSVQFIESQSVFHVQNKHAKYVVQADLETGTQCNQTPGNIGLVPVGEGLEDSSVKEFEAPFYSLLNLYGQRQLITVGDTGVDYDSCFFYDASHPDIPVNQNTLSTHRKIAAYITSPTSDDRSSPRAGPGDEEGHGTHTAGSVAGQLAHESFHEGTSVAQSTYEKLNNYSGIASQARLIVFDFQNPGDQNFYVPNDLYHDYLQVSYDLHSRLCSNSWGEDSGVYDGFTHDVDQFLWDHPDYLMVIAAGNLGGNGAHTIATPAIAKNLITVGASMNGVCSFFDLAMATGITFNSPPELQGTYPVTPASFGSKYITVPDQHNARGCYAVPSNACATLSSTIDWHGCVVFVDRGQCTYTYKAHMIELSGALMMVYLHDSADPNYIIDGDAQTTIGIPVITITNATGVSSHVRAVLSGTASSTASGITLDFPTAFFSSTLSEHALSDFSSKGPTLDGRIKPDILAPGEMIESAASDGNLNSFQCLAAQTTGSDGKIVFQKDQAIRGMEGTSMAAPVAAGTAGLVRQYYTDGHYVNPTTGSAQVIIPSSALMKATMISGTSPVNGTTMNPTAASTPSRPAKTRIPVESPPSYHQGWGRVELSESLAYDIPMDETTNRQHEQSKFKLFVQDNIPIKTGDVHKYCFKIASPTTPTLVPFKATLVWTDPPTVLPASMFLVNNLDLMVVGYDIPHPDGSTSHEAYIGNQRIHGDHTLFQPLFDVNNNVEKVEIAQPVPERIYSVIVRGTDIPVSTSPLDNTSPGQLYALVVNGDFESRSIDCPIEIYCLNDCSGHGKCHDSSSAIPPSVDNLNRFDPPNTGVCHCDPHFAGSDCSIEAKPIIPVYHDTTGELSLQVAVDTWTYVYYDINSTLNDEVITWTVSRTGSMGDPDFYWTVPNTPNPALSYPTLRHFDYANTDCDSCNGGQPHTLKMDKTVIYPSQQGQQGGGHTVILGIWGYCCDASAVHIRLDVTRPPANPGRV